jgi:hypothetical protein
LENHTEAEAREHINDSDRYRLQQLIKNYLNTLSIQGFGYLARKISNSKLYRQLNTFKVQGKPFEYTLF